MSIFPARFVRSISPSLLQSHLAQPIPTPLHLGRDLLPWSALSKWTLSNGLDVLRRGVGEDTEVEVEIGKKGRGYLDLDYQRINMGFGLFLDAFILNRIPSSDPDALPSAYLAQSDILDNQSIIDDIPPLPHFKSGPQSTVYRRTMWIGPAGSFTPFHRDPYIGIYSQVVGRKTFHVLPPPALLNPSTDPQHGNTSTIPLPVSHFYPNPPDTHPNTKPFPLETDDIPAPIIVHGKTNLDQAFQLDGACRVDLDEGESVLVPEGWWHSAEGGTSPGVGVGAWFT